MGIFAFLAKAANAHHCRELHHSRVANVDFIVNFTSMNVYFWDTVQRNFSIFEAYTIERTHFDCLLLTLVRLLPLLCHVARLHQWWLQTQQWKRVRFNHTVILMTNIYATQMSKFHHYYTLKIGNLFFRYKMNSKHLLNDSSNVWLTIKNIK